MLSSVIGFAQTDVTTKKNKFEFSTAYNSGSLKNLEFAPVARYDYKGLVYKLSYERRTKNKNIFKIDLNFLGKTALTTKRLSNFNTEILKAGINFSYLRPLYTKKSFTIHLGLQSQTNGSLFFDSNDYVDLHQEFGIASRFGYQINKKNYLSSKITIPFVLGRVTSKTAELYSLNKYQSVSWNLEYSYNLLNNFDLKATYDFKYNRLQIPSAYRELQQQLNLGIIYKF